MPTPEPYPYRKLNYPIVNLEQSFTLAEKLQALANLGVPSSVNKAGQVLTVGDATGELEWATVSGGGDVPSSSSADEGKVLTVDSNGEPQWAPPSGGGGGGDVTDVTVNGTSVVTNHVAEVTVPTKTSDLDNDSGFITSSDIPAIPTKTSELTNDSGFITSSDIPAIPTKTSELQNDSGFITAAALPTVNNGTLTVQKNGTTLGTFGANSATDKTIDIQVPGKTSDLQNDSGFITTSDLPTVDQTYDATSVNPQSGVAVAQAISGISVDEVPAVTSSDDGKVLTASYSGGQGSYSWETAGGSSTPDIFLATYGTTTFTEIRNAHNAGKAVFLYAPEGNYNAGKLVALESCFYSNYADQTYARFVLPFDNYGSYQAESRIQQNTVYVVNGNNVWSTNSAKAIASPTAADAGKIYMAVSGGGGAMWVNQRTPGNMLSVTNNQIDVTTTAGITDIQMVNALPANPVATVLYLIPET